MTEKNSLSRFAYIDTLRGLAALYVFFYHLALLPNLAVPYWAKQVVLSGGTGVTLFFLVSAFTLCHSMRGRSDDPGQLYAFYIRRLFRILPLFYVWIVISLVRDGYFYHVMHSVGDVFLSTFFLFNLIPGKETGFVWASWTLGVEMLFYLIFPLIFRYITDFRRALTLFLVTIGISEAFKSLLVYLQISEKQRESYSQFSFLHQLPIFIAGVLVFYLYESFIKDKAVDRSWGFVLMGLFVFLYTGLLTGKLTRAILMDSLYWQAIAYGCLLLGLSIFPWKVVVNKFTTFLGAISYSVYLCHMTVIMGLVSLYARIYAYDMPVSFKFSLSAVITLAIVILFSYISFRLIEKPSMKVGSWLIHKKSISRYQSGLGSEIETKVG